MSSEFHHLFALTVRSIRERNGISQLDAATRSGIDTKMLSKYEQGKKSPYLRSKLDALCDGIEATPDERLALSDLWTSIQTMHKNKHTEAVTRAARKPRDVDSLPEDWLALDPDIRKLQDQITAIQYSHHIDAPNILCGIRNAVKRIAEQATVWQRRVGDA